MKTISAQTLAQGLTYRYNDPQFSAHTAPKLLKIINERGGELKNLFKKGEKNPLEKDFLPDPILDALIEAIYGKEEEDNGG